MLKKVVWKVLSSNEIKQAYPMNDFWVSVVKKSKEEVKKILSWISNKKILILWPCSADFESSLSEYAEFISELRNKYSDKIEIIMRYYTWKPRTVWGWKGISNSEPWQTPDIGKWLVRSREIAISLIENFWVPLADEMLHPQLTNKFDDIYSYLAIWARSTENQYHREVASWLDIPVWFKNSTSWDLDVMTNSIKAWQTPSTYVISNSIYDTLGNDFSHWILRWGRISWENYSNYDKESLKTTIELLTKKWIQNPWFIVDTNHENSNKNHKKQQTIMENVFNNLDILSKDWVDVSMLKGFMVESYLIEWNQWFPADWDESKIIKWCSLTDPCISKEQTEVFVREMYNRLSK